MNLRMNHSRTTAQGQHRMPIEGTVEEIIAAAKEIYTKYHKTVKRTYGGGTQVEVICHKDGYHGREEKRVACYEIIEE